MDNKIAPVETFIKEGLVRQFRKTFNTDLTITNVSGKRQLVQKRAQGNVLKYPLAFAELSSMALATDRYRATPLLRRGIVGQATTDNLGTFQVPLIPVDFTYQILFITNNFVEAERYGRLWLMAAAGGFMTFSITYGVVNLDISFSVDSTINFPQRDSSPESIEEYEVTSSLLIRGWGSHDQLINKQAANRLEVEGIVASEIDKALAQSDSKGTVQVFKFTKAWPQPGPLNS